MARFIAVAAVLLLSITSARCQIVINGGFESGSFSPWNLLSDPEGGTNTFVTAGAGGITPFGGSFFATFSNHASNISGFSQSLTTTPGQTYALSYWFTTSVGSDLSNEFKVTWNGTTVSDLIGFSSLGAVWTNRTFFVTGTGTDLLTFSGYQNSGYNGLDAVSLVAVPEGASTTMLFLGLAALAVARRRRAS